MNEECSLTVKRDTYFFVTSLLFDLIFLHDLHVLGIGGNGEIGDHSFTLKNNLQNA